MSSEIVQQIKDRLDIVDYISRYVPDLKKAGRYYKACCPFHSEKTPSFVVNADNQTWRCFGACAEGGDVLSFAVKINGWTFAEALRELAQLVGIEFKPSNASQRALEERLDRLRNLLQAVAQAYHRLLMSSHDDHAQAALRYAREKRGFTDDTLRAFLIGYAPLRWDAIYKEMRQVGYSTEDLLAAGVINQNEQGRTYDRFRNRLIIPIRDEKGRVVGFGARALAADDTPKYLNSPQSELFDKSRLLFALDRARESIRAQETAVIVEGYMDAIQAHQVGYTNVVAQMGTALTEEQLKLIVPRYAKKIILALDADAAGQNAVRRSLDVAQRALSDDLGGKLAADIRILQMDDPAGGQAKDPDDVLRQTPHLWPDYVARALPVADFLIQKETAHLPPNATLQERREVALRVLPILSATSDNLYRQDNLQKLALRLRIDERDLLAWAKQMRQEQIAHDKARPRLKLKPSPPRPAPSPETAPDDEPPPLFFDDAPASSEEPPLFFDTDVAPQHTPKPKKTSTQSAPRLPQAESRLASRAAEGYCLRLLLQETSLFFEVRRHFNELAADDEALRRGALAPFGTDDFSQGDYRALMAVLEQALDQIDLSPLDFLRQHADPALSAEIDALLVEEDAWLARPIKGLSSDQMAIYKTLAMRARPPRSRQNDALRRTLEVRRARLRREQQELMFLIREANLSGDGHALASLSEQVLPMLRALRKLDEAIARLHQQL
ncbi:MAG: DNA primase [Anaerolineae bacterium]|nr:DNA primase [Anaerolineae bacterium]